MKTERLLIIVLIITIVLRFIWAQYGWGAEYIALFPPLIACIALLIYYHLVVKNSFYKASVLYFIIFVIGIIFNILEVRGRGFFLFLGSLGFILFPVYLLAKHRKHPETHIFRYSVLFCLLLLSQTILYLFFPTNKILTVAHMLSYLIIIVSGYIVLNRRVEEHVTEDEKKIITFIIIANILSLLGVTFKESFYYLLWI